MAIIRKSELKIHLQEFDDRCQKLREVLIGNSPNPNVFNLYSLNPEDFSRDFVELGADDLEYAVTDFAGSLKRLKKLGNLKAAKLGSSK